MVPTTPATPAPTSSATTFFGILLYPPPLHIIYLDQIGSTICVVSDQAVTNGITF
jgi:hypothetical protein